MIRHDFPPLPDGGIFEDGRTVRVVAGDGFYLARLGFGSFERGNPDRAFSAGVYLVTVAGGVAPLVVTRRDADALAAAASGGPEAIHGATRASRRPLIGRDAAGGWVVAAPLSLTHPVPRPPRSPAVVGAWVTAPVGPTGLGLPAVATHFAEDRPPHPFGRAAGAVVAGGTEVANSPLARAVMGAEGMVLSCTDVVVWRGGILRVFAGMAIGYVHACAAAPDGLTAAAVYTLPGRRAAGVVIFDLND